MRMLPLPLSAIPCNGRALQKQYNTIERISGKLKCGMILLGFFINLLHKTSFSTTTCDADFRFSRMFFWIL